MHNLLVQFDGVAFQGEHIVRKHNDFIVASFMISYQKLTGSELVGIHNSQQLQVQNKMYCYINLINKQMNLYI